MMKKISILLVLVLMLSFSLITVVTAAAVDVDSITKGEVFYSATHYKAGEAIPLGYDEYGYNYQAHMFSGSYANVYLGGYGYPPYEGDTEAYYQRLIDEGYALDEATAETLMAGVWCWPYRDVNLLMKWNDAWISNKDRDGDGKLDRHYGFTSYIGSGAWETNHQWGANEDGTTWNYFTKIVAVLSDAVKTTGVWYTGEGVEIGPDIWGEFATIMDVYNDPMWDAHGLEYLSPNNAGFGAYNH